MILSIPPAFTHLIGGSTLRALLGKSKYETLFPGHHVIYSYENFLFAAKSFPLFAQEGSLVNRKRELAAFFAPVVHERTTGWAGSKDGPYLWGQYHPEEQACKDKRCKQYNTGGSSRFRSAAGKSYRRRGPIQFSYGYNYGLAGKDLGLPILDQPELLRTNGVIANNTAIWFWKRSQIPKPSCHHGMCDKWHPSVTDSILFRKRGFGMTITLSTAGLNAIAPTRPKNWNEKKESDFMNGFQKL